MNRPFGGPSNQDIYTLLGTVHTSVVSLTTLVQTLTTKVNTMSATQAAQQAELDAITAHLTTIQTALTTDTQAILAEIATLQNANPQLDFTAVNTELANLDQTVAGVTAIPPATPPAPTP
jgi:hypothetical protein